EKVLGPNHPTTVITVCNLAGVLEDQGKKYSQAEEAYERVCTGFSKTLGEQHPTTLECIR
ncbi:hypothetical protein L873DRAFT_1644412, partial [Choiromyces venosus 120613-1]